MWSFASHKRIYSFRCGPLYLSTGCTGKNPYAAHFGRAGRANPQFPAKDAPQSIYQLDTIYFCRYRKSEILPLVEEERFWSAELKRLLQENSISDIGIQVQRHMSPVNSDTLSDFSFAL